MAILCLELVSSSPIQSYTHTALPCPWEAEVSYLVTKFLEVIEAALHHHLHKLLNG